MRPLAAPRFPNRLSGANTGVSRPNTSAMPRASNASPTVVPVPCAFTWSMSAALTLACASALRITRARPGPLHPRSTPDAQPSTSPRTVAPRARACSSVSSVNAAVPSPGAVPSRVRSNGRIAPAGSSLRFVSCTNRLCRLSVTGLMRASLPPTSITSASPRRRMRAASASATRPLESPGICVLLGPCMSYRMVAWHAGMFGRNFNIQTGVISFRPFAPQTRESVWSPLGDASFAAAAMSLRSVAPMSAANSIPMRCGGTVPFASPALAIASCEPMTPSSTVRAIDFSSLRYLVSVIIAFAEKPGTSPATREGSSVASMCEMVRTPRVPAARAGQKASAPVAIGETTPKPVSTNLRLLVTVAATAYGSRSRRYGRHYFNS